MPTAVPYQAGSLAIPCSIAQFTQTCTRAARQKHVSAELLLRQPSDVGYR